MDFSGHTSTLLTTFFSASGIATTAVTDPSVTITHAPWAVTLDLFLPLFVAVPLIGAALAAMIPQKLLRDILHLIIPAAIVVAATALFFYTESTGTIAHNVGRYAGGIAIPFAADPFTAVMLATTGLVALVSNWFASQVGETKARFYPALALMLTAGVNGALLTADLFNMFVFIEVMLLPSYGLIAMTGTWSRLASGRMFVLVNLATSTVFLIGVSLTYAVAGSANLAVLAHAAKGHGPITATMGLVIIALAVKAGLFPVHTWLPRTYPGTSPAVMGLFSGLHTKVAVYAIFRIYAVVFDLDNRWALLIIVACCASMLIGGYAGLAEHSMRRIIAYQMVNGMPFIVVVLAFTSFDPERALAAGIFYALHHMITVGSLTLSVGAIEETYGTGLLSKLSGLSRREPLVATAFVMGAFSIVGFPPFSGLWGKVFVVLAVAKEGNWTSWITIAVIIAASFGALISMLRLWREAFWGKDLDPEKFPPNLLVPTGKALPGMVLAIISVGMFVGAGVMSNITVTAADSLLDTQTYQHAILGDNLDGAVGIAGVRDAASIPLDASLPPLSGKQVGEDTQ